MIRRIKIKNFKNIKELEVQTPIKTIILGQNGQGKTAILEAIKWLVYKDKGPEVITIGAKSCAVEIETWRGKVARRTMNQEGKGTLTLIDKNTGEPIPKPAELLKTFLPYFALDPVSFALMDPKDQKEIVIKALESRLVLTEQDYKDMGIKPGQFQGTPLDVVKQAYKYWYDQRREANAKVKTLKGAVETAQVGGDKNALLEKKKGLLEELKRAKDAEQILREVKAAQDMLAMFSLSEEEKQEMEALEKEIKDLQKKQEKFNKKKAELEEFEKRAEDFNKQIEMLMREEKMLDEELKRFTSFSGKCPLDESITCPADIKNSPKAQEIKQKLEEKRGEIEKLREELKSLKKPRLPKDVGEELREKENRLLQLKAKQGDGNKVRELEAIIEKGQGIEILRSSDEIMEELKQVEVNIQLIEKNAGLSQQYKQAQIHAKKLDALVKVCKQKEEELLKRMQLPAGYELSPFGIKFKGVAMAVLSDKEKVVASIRFIKALYPKAKIFLIDGFEKFSKEIREKVIPILLKDNYQYFITCVASSKEEVASSIPKAFIMENGNIKEV